MIRTFTFTEQTLLNRIRAGDNRAFDHLYREYWKVLHRKATFQTSNQEEAADIVQNVFLNLWRNKENLQVSSKLEWYLMGAVRLESINSRTKKSSISIRDNGYLNSCRAAYEPQIVERIDSKSRLKEVRLSIEKLPKRCKLVFKLSRFHHYTYKQIAEELNISEKAVEKHISLALKRLRSEHPV